MDDERKLNRCPSLYTLPGGYEEGWRFQCDGKVDHWFQGERHYSHEERRGVDVLCFWTDEESELPQQIGPRLIVKREPQWYDPTIISGSGTLFPGLIDDIFSGRPLLWQIQGEIASKVQAKTDAEFLRGLNDS